MWWFGITLDVKRIRDCDVFFILYFVMWRIFMVMYSGDVGFKWWRLLVQGGFNGRGFFVLLAVESFSFLFNYLAIFHVKISKIYVSLNKSSLSHNLYSGCPLVMSSCLLIFSSCHLPYSSSSSLCMTPVFTSDGDVLDKQCPREHPSSSDGKPLLSLLGNSSSTSHWGVSKT